MDQKGTETEEVLSSTITKEPFLPTETALPRIPIPTLINETETSSQAGTDQDKFEIPYTPDNPLTDTDEILKILDALAQRHVRWLSRPGWYLYWQHVHLDDGVEEQWIRGTHFIDDRGECREQFFFRIRGGQMLPNRIGLADGTTAWLYDQRGQLEDAGVHEERDLCEMGNAGDVYELLHMAEVTEYKLEQKMTGLLATYDLRMWAEPVGGREMIVLHEDVTPSQPGEFRRQDGTWVQSGRNIQWTYFDPLSGGIVGRQGELYSLSGELLDGGWDSDWEPIELSFLDELPPEIAQVYDESAASLRDYLERQGQ